MDYLKELFNDAFIFRWLHIWFGIIWIGTLYYFNFMQMPFMGAAETEPAAKSRVTRTLLPKALVWFRHGAMGVFLTGLYLWENKYRQGLSEGVYWLNAGSFPITIGMTLGFLMFCNVWFVIWPKQKIVMANAHGLVEGKPADPNAAGAAARATLASRTNTLFSIPMLFFMVAGAHYGYRIEQTSSTFFIVLAVIMALIFAIEINALVGKMVKPLATVGAVIGSGFALWLVLYVLTRSVSIL